MLRPWVPHVSSMEVMYAHLCVRHHLFLCTSRHQGLFDAASSAHWTQCLTGLNVFLVKNKEQQIQWTSNTIVDTYICANKVVTYQ